MADRSERTKEGTIYGIFSPTVRTSAKLGSEVNMKDINASMSAVLAYLYKAFG